MPDSFFARLTRRALEIDSLLCVGLDPHPALLAEPTAAAASAFCRRLIEACSPYACAFKPNSAFFEQWGPAGLAALQEVIRAVPDGIPVILDAKRADIASTAEAYARAVFETLGADAVTTSPYLGSDALAPFLARPGRGVFVLCRTSNPGAGLLQDLSLDGGEPLYLLVARQAPGWTQYNNLGLVVGATDPAALAAVRAAAPGVWILAPGVGAQGGDLEGALSAGLRADGLGVLVAVSRGVAAAPDPAAAAAGLRDRINVLRCQASAPGATSSPETPWAAQAVADALLEAGCVRFGAYRLKSGQQSPIYLDLRRLASYPRALQAVADALVPLLRRLEFDRLAAIPYAALPIGTAVALATGWPLIYARRETKGHGTGVAVEGDYRPGDRAVVIDDLITTGESKLEAIKRLVAAGLQVRDVVVLVDRGLDAAGQMAASGYQLHAVVTLHQLLGAWRQRDALTAHQYEQATAWLTGG